MKRKIVSLLNVALLLVASGVLAQSGGDYDLEWQAIGSAGEQFVSGGGYQVGFTLAQDQEPMVSTGGSYQIIQGYWAGGGFAPTAVTLAGLWVEARGDTLVACWQTASEVDTLGFNVLRSESGDPGSFTQLNEVLIPSQAPGSPVGASYEWGDAGVEAGHTYFYLLEDIDIHGQATQHGPVSATLPPTMPYWIYLPLVNR